MSKDDASERANPGSRGARDRWRPNARSLGDDAHDLAIKARAARGSREDAYSVKLVVRFRGREIAHPENGREALRAIVAARSAGAPRCGDAPTPTRRGARDGGGSVALVTSNRTSDTEMMESGPDWAAWSREATQLMRARNAAFVDELGLAGRAYEWSLDTAKLVFPSPDDRVEADLCVVGSHSSAEGTFLWAWANDRIPATARRGLERVRQFGKENGLGLLTDAEWPAKHADGLEMATVAARVLDAAGIWIAPMGDVTFYFALMNIRSVSGREVEALEQEADARR